MVGTTAAGNCEVSNIDKWDCGQMGTNQAQCEADGCCWVPVAADRNTSSGAGMPNSKTINSKIHWGNAILLQYIYTSIFLSTFFLISAN